MKAHEARRVSGRPVHGAGLGIQPAFEAAGVIFTSDRMASGQSSGRDRTAALMKDLRENRRAGWNDSVVPAPREKQWVKSLARDHALEVVGALDALDDRARTWRRRDKPRACDPLGFLDATMMDRIEGQSVPAARVLVDALPWLIEQAEAGQLGVSAFMLRSALTEARKLVNEAERRCGRIASTADFLRQLGEETA